MTADAPAWDGVPERPGEDGWHWVRTHQKLTAPMHLRPWEWCASSRAWLELDGTDIEPALVRVCHYEGPCHTPAEVAALVAAARDDERERAARVCEAQLEYDGQDLPSIQALEYSHRYAANIARRRIAAAIRAGRPA